MKGPSLQKTAAASAALHITAFLLSVMLLRQSSQMTLPSPYVVNLVNPSGSRSQARVSDSEAIDRNDSKVKDHPAAPETAFKEAKKKDDTLIDERISAIAAKKRIERNIRLRDVISVSSKTEQTKPKQSAKGISGGPSKGQTGEGSYIDKITAEIQKEWAYPPTGEKNLEAVIAVRIEKNGELFVSGYELKSSSDLFNKLAVRTIKKASPVTPPPYEMEIGIRFYP